MQVFAPLARMLGLYSFKQELEELSFRYLQPEVHKNMVQRLAKLKKEQQPVLTQVLSNLPQHSITLWGQVLQRCMGVLQICMKL